MMKNKKCEIILYNFKNYLDSSFEEKEQTVKFIENMVADNNPKMQVV